ncbi:galectin-9-like [Venturia canescens]|uniref:galectin-9-like n=1 Tax=Venturia canescens TaxID=32260 RepID=UPI001C9C9B58|nr:galectin-9-like [Venturia canescens]
MSPESTVEKSVDKKQEAFKRFRFFDTQTQPLNVLSQSAIPIQLSATSAIIVTGYLPGQITGFAINLTCKLPGNVGLHFNPRLDRGYIVRNSKSRNSWENEETCSPALPSSRAFEKDSYFHLLIFCGANEFYIAINGEHFCEFHYRFSLETIEALEIVGGVEDVRTRVTNLCIYPDPKICKPLRNLKLDDKKPVFEHLKVPVTIKIDREFNHGARIFIKGRLKLLPHSFYVNLQRGEMLYPHPEIALHLNPRFQYGSRTACVVMNCWAEGAWSSEERHEGQLSWGPGRDFLLTIRCEYEGYMIWLGDKMIGEFKHRLQPTIVDTLKISGDVVLYEIAMSCA